MAMYVYSTGGEPVGFLYENFIHDMDGRPLGRIIGSRVHRFDGTYVGDWFKEMVVERSGAGRLVLPPIAVPPPRPSPGASWRRRAIVDYGYPDLFAALRGSAHSAPPSAEAA